MLTTGSALSGNEIWTHVGMKQNHKQLPVRRENWRVHGD